MAITDPELRPLLPHQREFVHLIVYQGLTKVEAYCQAYNKDPSQTSKDNLSAGASKLFYKPHINNYYNALMEEIRDTEIKKGAWTKEVATDKLLRLIERAESDIYDEGKQITMSRLQAIMQPVKELNTMNGFNQTNLNIEGQIVQIVGEDEIPE